MTYMMTPFETNGYYMIMSGLGWLLLIGHALIIWWFYRQMKKKS